MEDAPLVVVEEAPDPAPADPVTVIVDASPTIITPEPASAEPDALAMILEKLTRAESRLETLERGTSATQRQDVPPEEEVGPPPEPSASETVIAPTDEIAPAPPAATASPTKKHAGFWV